MEQCLNKICNPIDLIKRACISRPKTLRAYSLCIKAKKKEEATIYNVDYKPKEPSLIKRL